MPVPSDFRAFVARSTNGPPVEIEAPDGTIVEFPAGTPEQEIRRAMQKTYGGPAQPMTAPPATRRVSFEGKLHEYPSDASDDEIAEALERFHPNPKPTLPSPPPSAPRPSLGFREPQNENPLRAGTQGAARAIADTAMLPADLSAMGGNALMAAIDWLSRKTLDKQVGFRFDLPSDILANTASGIGEAVGFKSMDPDRMSRRERASYMANRVGGGAAMTAGALAPVAAARAAAGASRMPKFGDSFLKAYETAPGKVGAGDTIAGATGGAALAESQSLIPENVRNIGGGFVGAIADLAATTVGHVGGGTAAGLATAPRQVANRIRGSLPASDIGYDPDSGLATSNSQADTAARYVQSHAADPAAAADAIRAGANEYRRAGAPVPTSGALSNDPKLMTVERAARRDVPTEFAARDVALRDAALESVESIQPQNVDPRAATNFIRDHVGQRVGAAQSAVRDAETRLAGVDASQRATADSLRPLAGQSAAASESLDRAVLDKSLRPMDEARRADFAAVPRDATVPGEPFVEAAGRVRASARHLPENARAEILPEKRLEDFETYIVRDAKGNVTGARPMSFGVIQDLRPILSAETARARKAGAPVQYLDNLEALRREINKATNQLPEAETAMRNYEQRYAPVWGRGAGEAYRLRSDFNVDRSNRTASPPTATAGRFLTVGAGAKEKAGALARIVQSMPDPNDQAAAVGSVRQYVLANLTKTIGADGKISEMSLNRWLNGPSGWGDALSQFPSVRAEVDNLVTDVQRGNVRRNALATEVEQAARGLKRTQADIDNSALSLTLGREPVKAARAVLDSGDPQMAMREVAEVLRSDAGAVRAWKRAVSDHLIDRIGTVNPAAVSEGSTALDYGRLTKTFKQYEQALAEVFTPAEMSSLQRARKMLEPLARRSGPVAGSMPDAAASGAWKPIELMLKAHYGILKGGGVFRTLKIATSMFDGEAANAQRLVTRMMFDPELAAHLLTRKVAEVGAPAWNEKLGKLLRRSAVGREHLGSEEEVNDGWPKRATAR